MQYLTEQNPGYTMTLLRTRVLPLYSVSNCPPHLIACANWILGELASCLPEVSFLIQHLPLLTVISSINLYLDLLFS